MNNEHFLVALPLESLDLNENMVAAAVYHQAGETSHAALLIQFNGQTRVFHLFGSVLMDAPQSAIDEGTVIFFKRLDFIPPGLVSSFLAHCELIKQEAKPKFGFFYNSKSFYDAAGSFRTPGEFPEYLTCVGFCLTVLQAYLLEDEFLHTADWDHTSLDTQLERTARQMIEIQRNYPHLTPEDLTGAVRRILPIEYLSGAFSFTRPARKSFTDEMVPQLQEEITLRVA